MTIERHYVDPKWWARALEYRLAYEAYMNIPPARWVCDLIFDSYCWLTRKPKGYYGWWEPIQEWSSRLALTRLFSAPPFRSVIAKAGYRVPQISLTFVNEIECHHCHQPECICGNPAIFPTGTSYLLNDEPVSEDVFQAELDRFYRMYAYGQILERIPA